MTTDRRPIGRGQVAMTPGAILAESLAHPGRALTTEEFQDVVAAGLAAPDDFARVEGFDGDGAMEARWRYVGDRWEAAHQDGRPLLVEAGSAPRTHRALVERRFAEFVWTMRLLDLLPHTDADVSDLRDDACWAERFQRADAADRRLAEFRRRGGPMLALARERLGRLMRIVEAHGLRPTGDLAEVLETEDETMLSRRYLTVLEGRDALEKPLHDAYLCDDLEVAMERALTATVLGVRLFGTWDIDGADEPMIMTCDLRVHGPDGVEHAIRRVLPFAAAEGRPT